MKGQNQPSSDFKPAAGLYWLLALLSRLVFTLAFGLRIRRDAGIRKLRGPLLVIGNHPSYFDPFLMADALLPGRINFLAANVFFRIGWFRSLLIRLGAIPKVQFRTDSQALKGMLRIIRSGGILGIYPEGQRSLDGSRQPVDEAIAKLVRKLSCTVVAVHESGGYLTWPRWSQSRWRCGRIEIRASLLFTPQQLESLDVPEIQARIEVALDYQDYDWQRRRRHAYLSLAPALGLHVLCHQCPACGRDLAMRSSRFRLTCRFCGNQARMDRFGFLHPAGKTARIEEDQKTASRQPDGWKSADRQSAGGTPRVWPDPRLWHQWQLADIARRIRQPDFQLTFGAQAEILADDGAFRATGHGLLHVTAESLQYIGDPARTPTETTISTPEATPAPEASTPEAAPEPVPAPLNLKFPIRNKTGISADYGQRFEIILTDSNYRFILDEGQAVIMIADAIQAAQNPLDNPGANRG